jgi:hypothetical protein
LSVDDLRTWQGVVLGRAVSTLRSVETQLESPEQCDFCSRFLYSSLVNLAIFRIKLNYMTKFIYSSQLSIILHPHIGTAYLSKMHLNHNNSLNFHTITA